MRPSAEALELSRVAERLFVDAPWLTRQKQRLRCLTTPFEQIIDLVPARSRVLEVGSGNGLFLGLAAAGGRRIQGLGTDSSAAAVREAAKMAKRISAETDSELQFELRKAQDPLPEGAFDLVALIDVVHHLPPDDQEPVVRAAASRVGPGGIFVYKDMCVRPHWRAWANRVHDLLSYRQWVRYVEIEQVQAWAGDEGLALEQAERLNRYCYGHDLAVFRRLAE